MKPNIKIVTLNAEEQEYGRIGFFDQENVITIIERTADNAIFSINVDDNCSLELYKEDIPLIIKALQEFQKL